MTTDTPVHTRERELVTPSEMLRIVVDWTGGCSSNPGNSDIIAALLECGVERERLVMLAHALARGAWSRQAAGALVLEMLKSRRVRAAVVRHGVLCHGLSGLEARRDVRTLHAEARELVQREILAEAGAHAERRRAPAAVAGGTQ